MSWTACDCHGQTYLGRASTVYVRFAYSEGADDSRKRKLCPSGLSTLLGNCERLLTSSSSGPVDPVDVFGACSWCGEPRDSSAAPAVFLTVYKLGKEREDFAGCACLAHVAQARQDTLLDV